MGLLDRDYMRNAPRWHAGEMGVSAPTTVTYRRPRKGHPGRWIVLVVLLALGVLTWAGLQQHYLVVRAADQQVTLRFCYGAPCSKAQASVQHSAAAVARQPETGVHVCAPAAYLSRYLACTHDIGRFALRHLSVIHLSATGIDSANFTATNLTVNIGEGRADGGYTHLANFTVPVGLSYGVWSLPVGAAFSNAGVRAHAGRAYKIEVDEGNTLLGTASFAVVQ